ncbi:MAG: hypothetical protein ACYTF1_16465 [Planctomycetota bacterium]|jgi:Tfp pilus assembly protein PilN
MTMEMNLLPESYRQSRRHNRMFRMCLITGTILLSIELVVGLVFHLRADKTRNLFAEAEAIRKDAKALKSELAKPTHQHKLLTQQVTLAERLRSKHRWSRLFGMLAKSTPDTVVLSAVTTNPARWSPVLHKFIKQGLNTKVKRDKPVTKFIEGITIRGFAVDHASLYKLVSAVNVSKMFVYAKQ